MYQYANGTSMTAPHVTGAEALLMSASSGGDSVRSCSVGNFAQQEELTFSVIISASHYFYEKVNIIHGAYRLYQADS